MRPLPSPDPQGHEETTNHHTGQGAFVDVIVSPDPLGLEYPSPISEKNGSRPEDGNYEDDPEAGVYWGPKQPNGMHTRWSRPWFDWRSERSIGWK